MKNKIYKKIEKILSIFVLFVFVLSQLSFNIAFANNFSASVTQDDIITSQEVSSFDINGVAEPFDEVYALVYDDNTLIGPIEFKDTSGNTVYTISQRKFTDFLSQIQAALQNPSAYSVQLGNWTISGTQNTHILFSKDSSGVYHILIAGLEASDGSSSFPVNWLISSNNNWGISGNNNNQVLSGSWSTGPQGVFTGTSKFLGSSPTDPANGYSFTFASQDFSQLQDGAYKILFIASSSSSYAALIKSFLIDTLAPQNIALDKNTFKEDTPGAAVGTLSSDDPAASYLLCGSSQDEMYFEIVGTTLKLKDAQSIDYENPIDSNQDNIYEVCVRAKDKYGNSADKTFNISPDNIDLKVVAAKTRDRDFDGYIDAIELQFNLPIDGRTVNISDFSVSAYTITSLSKIDDYTYDINLDEKQSYDTDFVPSLEIVGTVKAKSPAQNELIDGSQTPVQVSVTDGAAPFIKELSPIGISNDPDPDYSFELSESATLNYQNCYASLNQAIQGVSSVELFASQNTPFQDGTYSNCTIYAKDSNNNSSSLTVSAFTIDTQAPKVTLKYSKNPVSEGVVTITAQYSENVFEVPLISIDQPGSADISQAQMSGQVPGAVFTYDYTVHKADGTNYIDGLATVSLSQVKDQAGNLSNNPSNNTFVIDTTPPQAPGKPDLLDQSDSGVSNTDDITNVNNVEIFVLNVCESQGDTALLYVNGVEAKSFACVSAPSSVRFSLVSLTEGQNQIYAKTKDEAGNISQSSQTLLVTLDTKAPNAPSIDKFYDDTGVPGISNNDNHTSDSSISFEGSFDAQDTDTLTLYKYDELANVWDAQNVNITLDRQTGKWVSDILQNAMTVSQKWYKFKVEAKDLAGNTSSSQEFQIFYDTTAPSAPSLTHRTIYQNYNNTSVEFTAQGESEAYIEVLDANLQVICSGQADSSGVFRCTHNFANEGAYDFAAVQTDKAGNKSNNSQTDTVYVDAAAPTFTVNDGVDPNPNKEDTINITVSDNGVVTSGVDNASLEYAIVPNNNCSKTDFANASTKGSFSSSQDFTIAGDFEGQYLCVKASDNVGNTRYEILGMLHTDNTKPQAVSVSAKSIGDSTSPKGDIIKIEFSDVHEVVPKDSVWSDNEMQIYRINGTSTTLVDLQGASFVSSFDSTNNKTELLITLNETSANYLKNTDKIKVDFVQGTIIDEAGNELDTQTLQSANDVLNDSFAGDDTRAPLATASSSKKYIKNSDTVSIEFEFDELLDLSFIPTVSIDVQGASLVNSEKMQKKDQDGLLWSYEFTVATSTSGTLNVSVEAEDRAGNRVTINYNDLLVLDNENPSVSIDQNKLEPNAQKANPEFSGLVQDNNLQAGVTVSVYAGKDLLCETVTISNTWQCTSSRILPESRHNIDVYAKDKAGNTASSTAVIVVASLFTDKSQINMREGKASQFAVKLNAKPQGQVILNLQLDKQDKASLSKTSLVFDSNNWDTYQYVTVSATEDKDTSNEQVNIKISVDDAQSSQEFHHVSDKYIKLDIADDDKGGTIFAARGGGGISFAFKPADFNKDGKVDILDFNYLMVHWGSSNPGAADLDSDGDVDIFDFNLLMIEMNK